MAEKKEHMQAKWLRAIADGETLQWRAVSEPWRAVSEPWESLTSDQALKLFWEGRTAPQYFRIKPRTITIGKHEVAEPMREAPERLTDYFSIAVGRISDTYWNGSATDYSALASGMCWLKREDAELAAKAITELLTGDQP